MRLRGETEKGARVMCKKLVCIDSNYKLLSDKSWVVDDILKSDDILITSTCDLARKVAGKLDRTEPVYVCGCDDMEPVNLCAALVKDNPTSSISLVVDKNTGSISTRATAAGISYVMNVDEFLNTLNMFGNVGCESQAAQVRNCSFRVPEQSQTCEAEAVFEKDIERFDSELSDDSIAESKQSDAVVANEVVSTRNSNCWVMSVFSGCGGSGKSTVSTIAANLLSALGNKVLLADFDFQFGDLSFISGAKKILTFEELERSEAVLQESVESQDSGLVLLKAPEKIEDSEILSCRAKEIISSATNYFDAIVVNTSASWSDVHADLLAISERSLFLVDQKASSVRGCKHALELAGRLNISNQLFTFALNRCSKKSMLCGLDVIGALDINDIFELSDGGRSVEELLSVGKIGDLLRAKNALAMSVFDMLCSICPLCKDGKKSKKKSKKSRWH